MTATLLPIWPLIAGAVVLVISVICLFMSCAASHRRGWCLDCSEACDDELLCACCRRQAAELVTRIGRDAGLDD